MATAPRKSVKAVDAATDEDAIVTFGYDGVEYSYERKVLNKGRVLQAVDDNKLTVVIREVIGVKQYEAFMESLDPDIEEMTEFCQAMFEAAGTTPGE
jgi:hypothetical protein